MEYLRRAFKLDEVHRDESARIEIEGEKIYVLLESGQPYESGKLQKCL